MFNKETEYAMRGLVYIQAQNMKGRRPGIAEITKEIDAPQFFTAKILQRLVKHGLVASIKGKSGGFYFKEENNELLLRDLLLYTEGNKTFASCVFGFKQCDCQSPCPMHDRYIVIREAIEKMVSTESIQSLAKKTLKAKLK